MTTRRPVIAENIYLTAGDRRGLEPERLPGRPDANSGTEGTE